jgi:hypothetical protein
VPEPRGDATGDGKVDLADLGVLASNWGPAVTSDTEIGDANADGEVSLADLGILASNWGRTDVFGPAFGDANFDGGVDLADLGILAANWGAGVTAVPEPGTLTMLAVAATTMLRRRHAGQGA